MDIWSVRSGLRKIKRGDVDFDSTEKNADDVIDAAIELLSELETNRNLVTNYRAVLRDVLNPR